MAAIHIDVGGRDEAMWLRIESSATAREGSWRRRARYWLNSFRGFAMYDVRGGDPR